MKTQIIENYKEQVKKMNTNTGGFNFQEFNEAVDALKTITTPILKKRGVDLTHVKKKELSDWYFH